MTRAAALLAALGLGLATAVPARAEVLVLRSGAVDEVREVEVDEAAGVLVHGSRRREVPLATLYLAETDEGELLWAADHRARLRGYHILARARVRERARELTRDAIRAKDVVLARVLFERAQQAGLTGDDAARLARRLRSLEDRADRITPRSSAEGVREAAAALDTIHEALLLARAKREPGDSLARLRLLRAVLRASPEYAPALEELRARVPKGFPLEGARTWLAWRLEVEARGGAFADPEGFELRRARDLWRPDVYGVRTGPVLMITPVRDCTLVGRSLALGQLADRVLGRMFADFPVVRQAPPPMTVFLYPDKEEYTTRSGTGARYEDSAQLEWTAGHYNPQEGISRFFWHRDRDAERRILGTCVHELTHHWLRERNPAYALSQIKRHGGTPGFWIIEGFATLMEEGVYDIDAGRAWMFDERARSLDVIHSLREERSYIPWKLLYGLRQADFVRLDPEPKIDLVRRWALGRSRISVRRLFYEQAAATCQFLYHAEEGRHRAALLRYVVDAYRGDEERLDVETAFGMSPETLGRKVEEFATAVATANR